MKINVKSVTEDVMVVTSVTKKVYTLELTERELAVIGILTGSCIGGGPHRFIADNLYYKILETLNLPCGSNTTSFDFDNVDDLDKFEHR
jgi:hypothetical protein